MSEYPYIAKVFVALILLAAGLFVCQKSYKKILDRSQYDYIRDVTLVTGFFMSVLWFGGYLSRFVVGASFCALMIGILQQKYKNRDLRFLFILIGIMFALWGPGIRFIGLPGGEYMYLSGWTAMLITTIWIAIFPALIQELDHIPGMSGHLLAITFILSVAVTFFSGQDLGEAFLMSLTALLLLAVFWSRHGHMYRQLGSPLAAFWGTVLAGTSLLGVSKGITFSTLMILPLGLFAIPIMETSLHFASVALSNRTPNPRYIYRGLIKKGIEHPTAVHLITLLCATLGAVISVIQLTDGPLAWLITMFIVVSVVIFSLPVISRVHSHPLTSRAPRLWGVAIDNVSMNYAISKVRIALKKADKPFLVVTLNALAAHMARNDVSYRRAASGSSLCLADGWGIIWALKLLGTEIQERVTGIDFMEQVCRCASIEGWPVFLLGASEDTVNSAAHTLVHKFPGLNIAGCQSGYFTEEEEPQILERIRRSGAKVIFAGMGVPKQEIWLDQHLEEIGPVVGVGVGGAFDVISGKLKRAPDIFQKCGLEWFYRLVQEPWRFKRDLHLLTFVLLVFLTKAGIIENRKEDIV